MAAVLPIAPVLWWNREWFYVSCPYCGEAEPFRYGGHSSDDKQPKKSRCDVRLTTDRRNYTVVFPTSFEVHKEMGRCENVEMPFPPATQPYRQKEAPGGKEGQADDPVSMLENMTLGSNTTESPTTSQTHLEVSGQQGPSNTIETGVNISNIWKLCEHNHRPSKVEALYGEDDFQKFVQGAYSKHHDSPLHFVSERSDDPLLLSYLVVKGANVNGTNFEGRTPLMLAALCNKLENVKLLVGAGADVQRRDMNGHTALEFVKHSSFNARLRALRNVSRSSCILNERDRNDMVELLTRATKLTSVAVVPSSASNRPAYPLVAWTRHDNDTMYQLLQSSERTFEHKYISDKGITKFRTVAILQRGPGYPDKIAISGWLANGKPGDDLVLPKKIGLDAALGLGHLVGHVYPDTDPIEVNACHAEKQLLAWFVDKHMMRPSRPLSHYRQFMESSLVTARPSQKWTSFPDQKKQEIENKLPFLLPTEQLRRARIVVSREPCEDCMLYYRKVLLHFDLNIELLVSECLTDKIGGRLTTDQADITSFPGARHRALCQIPVRLSNGGSIDITLYQGEGEYSQTRTGSSGTSTVSSANVRIFPTRDGS